MTINGIALAIALAMCAVAYFCGYMSGRSDGYMSRVNDEHKKRERKEGRK